MFLMGSLDTDEENLSGGGYRSFGSQQKLLLKIWGKGENTKKREKHTCTYTHAHACIDTAEYLRIVGRMQRVQNMCNRIAEGKERKTRNFEAIMAVNFL